MAIVGVIPAAGHALRLQPLPHSKEVLDIGGRPIMDYLVDRMRAGGAEEIRVVTRPEKEDVIANCERLRVSIVLTSPATINESFAAGLAGLDPADIVLLGFPDSLWEPADGFRRLVDEVESGSEVALGLFDVPGIEGSDYLVLDEAGRIADIDIKPAVPRSTWIWGCAAARASVLDGLSDVEWPSTHMLALRSRGVAVEGVPLSSTYLDVGTRSSLERVPAVLRDLGSARRP
jgi:glucose-1-phosphate thymidylyltransferase